MPSLFRWTLSVFRQFLHWSCPDFYGNRSNQPATQAKIGWKWFSAIGSSCLSMNTIFISLSSLFTPFVERILFDCNSRPINKVFWGVLPFLVNSGKSQSAHLRQNRLIGREELNLISLYPFPNYWFESKEGKQL